MPHRLCGNQLPQLQETSLENFQRFFTHQQSLGIYGRRTSQSVGDGRGPT